MPSEKFELKSNCPKDYHLTYLSPHQYTEPFALSQHHEQQADQTSTPPHWEFSFSSQICSNVRYYQERVFERYSWDLANCSLGHSFWLSEFYHHIGASLADYKMCSWNQFLAVSNYFGDHRWIGRDWKFSFKFGEILEVLMILPTLCWMVVKNRPRIDETVGKILKHQSNIQILSFDLIIK